MPSIVIFARYNMKLVKKIMLWILIIIGSFFLVAALYMKQEKFGKNPSGKRLEAIKKSPNYRNGQFQNINHTPSFEDVSFFEAMQQFFFTDKPRNVPAGSIPSQKTSLTNMAPGKDALVWFGHSSYFIQIDGKKILVDPIFSDHAAPVSFSTKAFKGANAYTAQQLPEIDYLFITHDHWDHLDHATLKQLQPKIKRIITGLGIGAHLEHWGFDPGIIIEKDWNETIVLDDGFVAHSAPARHFSGRTLVRNKTLWTSWVLQTPTMKIYIGGDSGYDTHFADVGKKYGPIDLAILDNGQYNKNWKYIHLMPGEILKAANDLHAKNVLPVHSAKFALAMHPWDEPLINAFKAFQQSDIKLITPMIGEEVRLKDSTQVFSQWWVGVD